MAIALNVLNQSNLTTQRFSAGNKANIEICIDKNSIFGTAKLLIKEFVDDNFEGYICTQPNVKAEFTDADQIIPLNNIKNGSFFMLEIINADITTNIITTYIY